MHTVCNVQCGPCVSRSWLLYWRSAMTFLQRAANGPVLVRPHLHAGIYAGRRTTSCLNPQSKKVLVLHTALHVSVVIAAKYNFSSNASKKRLLGSRPSAGSLMLGYFMNTKAQRRLGSAPFSSHSCDRAILCSFHTVPLPNRMRPVPLPLQE